MQTADPQAFQKALSEQGELLGRHQHVLSSVTQSLESLANQQAEQQAQLVQLVNSVKEMTSQFQSVNLSEQRVAAALLPVTTGASASFFPVSKPDKYEGDPDKCRGFLLQCAVFFENSACSTDQARISFVISRLTDRALEWATASWASLHQLTYDQFVREFKLVFDHLYEGKVSGEPLLRLRQGTRSVVDYALEFRTLAASSGWNEAALLVTFRQGLNPEILKKLASKDDGLNLDQLVSLAIKMDHLINSHMLHKNPRNPRGRFSHINLPKETSVMPEPMICDSVRLSREEKQRRIDLHLCLYCGQAGHVLRECRSKPQYNRAATSGQHLEFTPRANAEPKEISSTTGL
ncbi:hypothetical protein AOLI_G00324320 [Acnodon oligacanthus]